MNIDTANNSLRYRKNPVASFINMTLTDDFRILYNQIKANQVQYDLHRVVAKISALLSKKMDEYEYLTGKDLGIQARSSWTN